MRRGLKPVVPTVVVDGEEVPGEVPEPTPIRVKIWRTPQFTEWYEENLMTVNGQISGVEHLIVCVITTAEIRLMGRCGGLR